MKTTLSALALIAALAATGSASAQVPSGGAGTAAKGNAPVKRSHTVNDGIARKGSNSFTEGQARGHIERAGYSGVTGLTKGRDGVWRGQAMKNGATVDVGMDYKGNVSEGGAMVTSSTTSRRTETVRNTAAANATPAPGMAMADRSGGGASTARDETSVTTARASMHSRHHRHHRAPHHMRRCAHPGPNGVACSGIDRNRNSISDKEDRAIRGGAKP